MRQEVFEDAIATKVTDYMGETLVEDNLIAQIAHDEGRIVPHRTETDSIDRYMYQYHLTDHLGNIRVTFGEEEIDSYTATMESEDQNQKEKEEAIFNNMHTRFINSQANNTNPGDEVARLNNTQPIGPAISLKVYPGDEIDMDVWAYYNGTSGYAGQMALTSWVNELASAFGGASGAPGEAGAIYDGINGIGATIFGGNNGSTQPAAYLNYILFDDDFGYITHGYEDVTTAAQNAKEHVVQSTVTVTQPGYIFVYVSSENDGSNWVHFDDLNVVRTEGEIKQETHYYPFGLTQAVIGKQGSNPFKYNGKEDLDELDVGWIDYGARMYDASLGRFNGVDRFAYKYPGLSSYQYAANNPVLFIDVNGDSIDISGLLKDKDLTKVFRAFFNSRLGHAFIKQFAAKDQTIFGHTFNSDGKLHSEGIDVSITSESLGVLNADSGNTQAKVNEDDDRLKVTVTLNSDINSEGHEGGGPPAENYAKSLEGFKNGSVSKEAALQAKREFLSDRGKTLVHESFIHVYHFANNYIDGARTRSELLRVGRFKDHHSFERANQGKTKFSTDGIRVILRIHETLKSRTSPDAIKSRALDF